MKNEAFSKEIITTCVEETLQLGKDFADKSGFGIIRLHGDLGSGKTTFMQGFAKGLGISKRILSPTFILMRTYSFSQGILYHLDMYRIQSSKDIGSLNLPSLWEEKNAIVAIEWPMQIEAILPQKGWTITFSYEEETRRKIHISYHE